MTSPTSSTSSTSTTGSAATGTNPAAASQASTSTSEVTSMTTIKSMADLRQQAPQFYNLMMQSIAETIIQDSQRQSARLVEAMRKGSQDAGNS